MKIQVFRKDVTNYKFKKYFNDDYRRIIAGFQLVCTENIIKFPQFYLTCGIKNKIETFQTKTIIASYLLEKPEITAKDANDMLLTRSGDQISEVSYQVSSGRKVHFVNTSILVLQSR